MCPALELIRLAAALAAILVLIPWLIFRRPTARAVVHAAFLLQIAAMVLGDWKLYLPGAACALYLTWCGATAWILRRRENFAVARSVSRWAERLEKQDISLAPRAIWRGVFGSGAVAGVAAIAAAVALRAAWFALHNVRLLRLESYTRAISLHSLMRGDAWDHDPSVALLAPLAWLSGLMPDQVIRYSGALVAAGLILATAFAGWRRLKTSEGAVVSAAILAGLLMALNLVPSEPTGAEWSAIFVILAAGLAGEEWGTAALSLLTAALIHLGLSPLLLLVALALTLASMMPAVLGRAPALAALAVIMAAMLIQPRGAAPEHQYEAAARVAHRIAGEFRVNDWIVISPGLEVVQTYGRGWHVELADFVNEHSEAQVSQADFRFPYAAQSVFVFVEKRVLEQPAFSFAHDGGAAPYYYSTRLGRASLEYRAARVMASYVGTHRDAAVYYEDDDLIVYRIARQEQRTEPSLTASAQLQ